MTSLGHQNWQARMLQVLGRARHVTVLLMSAHNMTGPADQLRHCIWTARKRAVWMAMQDAECRSWPRTVISLLASSAPKVPAVAVCGAEGIRHALPSALWCRPSAPSLATLPSSCTQVGR